MNTLTLWLEAPLSSRIGWTLLHSLWQGALIGGLFEVGRYFLRRRSADARYLLGCCALLALLAAPVITFLAASFPETSVRPSFAAVSPDEAVDRAHQPVALRVPVPES